MNFDGSSSRFRDMPYRNRVLLRQAVYLGFVVAHFAQNHRAKPDHRGLGRTAAGDRRAAPPSPGWLISPSNRI